MAVKGKKWTITPNRKVTIMTMLERQHTLETIATAFGITDDTLRKAFKRAGIKWDRVRATGIKNVRAKMLERMEKIDKDKDYCEVAIKVLDRYDNTDDTTTGSSTAAKSTKDIAAKILEELQDV